MFVFRVVVPKVESLMRMPEKHQKGSETAKVGVDRVCADSACRCQWFPTGIMFESWLAKGPKGTLHEPFVTWHSPFELEHEVLTAVYTRIMELI